MKINIKGVNSIEKFKSKIKEFFNKSFELFNKAFCFASSDKELLFNITNDSFCVLKISTTENFMFSFL